MRTYLGFLSFLFLMPSLLLAADWAPTFPSQNDFGLYTTYRESSSQEKIHQNLLVLLGSPPTRKKASRRLEQLIRMWAPFHREQQAIANGRLIVDTSLANQETAFREQFGESPYAFLITIREQGILAEISDGLISYIFEQWQKYCQESRMREEQQLLIEECRNRASNSVTAETTSAQDIPLIENLREMKEPEVNASELNRFFDMRRADLPELLCVFASPSKEDLVRKLEDIMGLFELAGEDRDWVQHKSLRLEAKFFGTKKQEFFHWLRRSLAELAGMSSADYESLARQASRIRNRGRSPSFEEQSMDDDFFEMREDYDSLLQTMEEREDEKLRMAIELSLREQELKELKEQIAVESNVNEDEEDEDEELRRALELSMGGMNQTDLQIEAGSIQRVGKENCFDPSSFF